MQDLLRNELDFAARHGDVIGVPRIIHSALERCKEKNRGQFNATKIKDTDDKYIKICVAHVNMELMAEGGIIFCG